MHTIYTYAELTMWNRYSRNTEILMKAARLVEQSRIEQ
jgi:hypothetical protein